MGRRTAEFWRRKLNVGEREENRMCKAWPSFFLLCSSLTLSITFMPLKKQKWKWVWLYSLSQKSRLRRIIFLLWKSEMLQIIRGNKKFTGGPRTTLYMYEWKTWYVATTEVSFCIDKPRMNLWYFPT